jgi:HAE1 family hydrophobic/amphiphilic exporter-1
MKLPEFSVKHPIFTIMLTLIVIVLGAVSFSRLPIDLMPDITYPTLSIQTSYENASPEEIEELITRPVEGALSAVPGVENVYSTSSEGSSSVRVTFSWGTDLDAAANDIRDRLDRIMPVFPEEAERPRLRKFDLASFPILILGASSDLDPIQMRRILDDQIKYRIERVPGVASVDIWGGLEREIHVNLYQDKIKSLGLPLDYILSKVRSENVDVPAGTIERGNFEVLSAMASPSSSKRSPVLKTPFKKSPGLSGLTENLEFVCLLVSNRARIPLISPQECFAKSTRLERIFLKSR